MADELQLWLHTELCKTTVENTKLVTKHLKINKEELNDKTKVPIINKIFKGQMNQIFEFFVFQSNVWIKG